jgi:hypothetical protein
MASLYKKVISGKPYWYLREMARVDGKPKMVSETTETQDQLTEIFDLTRWAPHS